MPPKPVKPTSPTITTDNPQATAWMATKRQYPIFVGYIRRIWDAKASIASTTISHGGTIKGARACNLTKRPNTLVARAKSMSRASTDQATIYSSSTPGTKGGTSSVVGISSQAAAKAASSFATSSHIIVMSSWVWERLKSIANNSPSASLTFISCFFNYILA